MQRAPDPGRTFACQVRVYYEDVDIGVVVCYANYLRFSIPEILAAVFTSRLAA